MSMLLWLWLRSVPKRCSMLKRGCVTAMVLTSHICPMSVWTMFWPMGRCTGTTSAIPTRCQSQRATVVLLNTCMCTQENLVTNHLLRILKPGGSLWIGWTEHANVSPGSTQLTRLFLKSWLIVYDWVLSSRLGGGKYSMGQHLVEPRERCI